MKPTTNRRTGAVAMIALSATFCLAGHWEFEQVDGGSIGSYVAIDKMSDGTIWLAYVNSDSAIRLAHRDSVWEYEDLDTATVRPGFPSWQTWPPFSFNVGPEDVIGVVGLGRLAERRDTSWSSEQLPMSMTDMAFSYDLAGRPSITFKDSLWRGCLGVRTDSGWDTSVVFIPQGIPTWFSLTRPCWRQRGDGAFLYENDWGDFIQEYRIGLCRRDSGIWTRHGLAGGLGGGGYVFDALPDTSDSIHTFWSATDIHSTNKLVCDGVVLDSFAGIGAACLDDSGRVQCAWVIGDVLKYALAHEPPLEVGSGGGIGWCDITTDTLSQPVIAYCTNGGSIYVAHGIEVAGLSSESRETSFRDLRPSSSIVKGVLFLPRDMTRSPGNPDRVPRRTLLDVSGRCVMVLRPGANDVSSKVPGVYFVTEQPQAVSYKPQAVRKIVIAR